MNTFTLPPNHNRPAIYDVGPRGRMRFEVDSEYAISTFVLDETGYNLFRQGSPYYYRYGGFDNATEHRGEVFLPFRGKVYLVMMNRSLTLPTAVHYNVWFP